MLADTHVKLIWACFCRCNFLLNNVVDKVLLLTHRREKYLVVAAVRFIRTILSRHVSKSVFGHLEVLKLLSYRNRFIP